MTRDTDIDRRSRVGGVESIHSCVSIGFRQLRQAEGVKKQERTNESNTYDDSHIMSRTSPDG